jgi:hypothetical protein
MQTTFKTANNKAIASKFFELISEGNVEELYTMITPDWKMHIGLGSFEIPLGPEGLRKLFESFGNIEQQWIIEDILADGNKVVVRAINNCKQENFFGIPSYGRMQTFTATFIHHIENGRIKETWRNADDLGRILQLGASIVPANG